MARPVRTIQYHENDNMDACEDYKDKNHSAGLRMWLIEGNVKALHVLHVSFQASYNQTLLQSLSEGIALICLCRVARRMLFEVKAAT